MPRLGEAGEFVGHKGVGFVVPLIPEMIEDGFPAHVLGKRSQFGKRRMNGVGTVLQLNVMEVEPGGCHPFFEAGPVEPGIG